MTIPFIRMFPNGKRGLQEIERPKHIKRMAAKFIANDGRFLTEILKSGDVSLIAIIDVNGTAKDVARETTKNGPELLAAVDRLVRASHGAIPADNPVRLLVPATHTS